MSAFQISLAILIIALLAWSLFDYTKEKEREENNDIHDRYLKRNYHYISRLGYPCNNMGGYDIWKIGSKI